MSTELTTLDDQDSRLMMAMAPTASTAIQLAAALVDKRIATARTYPRSIHRFKQEATSLLREDIETARSAEYAKPVGGSTVKGPSIRLAELVAMCWGNLDIEVSEPIVGDKSVSVKATAWDLQRNYRQEAIATTSILTRQGARFPAHMIETAALATAAKAKRNAILAVVPRAYVNDLLEVAKQVARGNEKPLEVVRAEILDYFARSHKVSKEQIFTLLEIGGIDDIDLDRIDTLRGIATAIKEGSSPDEFFTKVESKADAVKAKLADRKKKPEPVKAPDAPQIEQPKDSKLFGESQGLPD